MCNSLALGRVPPQGRDGWGYTRQDILERLFVEAYIRDHEPQRVLHKVVIGNRFEEEEAGFDDTR